jgi:hypothetical protein
MRKTGAGIRTALIPGRRAAPVAQAAVDGVLGKSAV